MQIAENIVLGFDLGIASIGWAIIDEVEKVILDAGVWTFNAPETDKEKTPKNQIRQAMRSMRRTIKHRRQRMNDVRDFLFAQKLLPANSKSIAHEIAARFKTSPWELRAEALKRKLTDEELGLVLYHIARHRGFQSNRKGGENAEAGEDQKALKAMQGLGQSIASYSTFGQALTEDDELSIRKRNISGDYGRTPKRDWLRQELAIITERQNSFGASLPSHIIEEFIAKAFTQRPLQDVADRVANCPFEKDQKRSSKHAPSFEYFRFLQKLNHISLWMPGAPDRTLTPEEIQKVAKEFGSQVSYTYKSLRKTLDIDVNARFRGVAKEDESQDIATRKSGSAIGTRALRTALSGLYDTTDIAQLDDAMFAIAFHETTESVGRALSKIGLPQNVYDALMIAVGNNQFKDVKGAAHISAKACRNIIPGLLDGLVYSAACERENYDHTAPDASPLVNLKKELVGKTPSEIRKAFSALLSDKNQHLIGSPVAKKALIEAVKQFVAIVNNHNALGGKLPGKVHVEMARDVGKSADERRKIEQGIEKRNKTLDNVAKDFEQTFGRQPRRGSNDILTFELAQEQGWKCVYTGDAVNPQNLFDGISYQIDHILPWSRFGDDSYANKTLCSARANQAKKHRTPVEWAQSGENGAPNLDEYLARVEACKEMRGIKKRNYTLKNAKDVEDKFRTRNLNDTRWACRLFLQSLDLFYEDTQMKNPDGKEIRRLYARPGSIIAKARQAWGVESLKKDENGKRREDDRHHAIDAITIAAMSESMLQALTKAHQQAEDRGSARAFEKFEKPWPMFRDDVVTGIDKVLVARAEDRKVSGQKHMETVRALDEETGVVFERLPPEKLLDQTTKKVDESKWYEALSARFERPERSSFVIEELLRWEREGRPQDRPPLATNRKDGEAADKIGKIRVIATGSKPAVRVRGGTADRGDMARVDVFSKVNAKGKKQFFLVPIYPHQVAGDENPPNRAVAANTPEENWPELDSSFGFEFSIVQKSWIEAIKTDGTVIEGYFRGMDRGTGAVNISPHITNSTLVGRPGAKTLLSFAKYTIDRLGTKHKIEKEVRTWRGKPWDWPQ
ncbi:MAG: type II CRISPR RNA-guided endonuclease Cas9 [Caulobacterales bacterium]|nr:type II CRISPR RNA-guided endonuclease Cas9 [Caulobacterales bacterium]MCA0373653.1 type II CRISPR RNA-guided endonuclease Cas9 [Pseudomonadota bacterium]